MASMARSTRTPLPIKYVFRFDIHIDPVIDGDRCSSTTVDRQRNEMKSITNNSTWAKVQGNWDEWQILEWKFKLPARIPTDAELHAHPSAQGPGWPEQRQSGDHDYSPGRQFRSEQENPDYPFRGRSEHGQRHDRGQHPAL